MLKLTVFQDKSYSKPRVFEGATMAECIEKLMLWLTDLDDEVDGIAQRIVEGEPTVALERTETGWELKCNPNTAIWNSAKFQTLDAALTEFRARLTFEGDWSRV